MYKNYWELLESMLPIKTSFWRRVNIKCEMKFAAFMGTVVVGGGLGLALFAAADIPGLYQLNGDGPLSQAIFGIVLIVFVFGALLGVGVAALLLGLTSDVFGATLKPATTATTVAIVTGLGLLASIGAVRRVLAIDPIAANQVGGI